MNDTARRRVGLLLLATIVGAGAYFAWPREKPTPEPPPADLMRPGWSDTTKCMVRRKFTTRFV